MKITCKVRHPQFTDNAWVILGIVHALPEAVALFEAYSRQPHIMAYSEQPGAVPFDILGTITVPLLGDLPVIAGQGAPVADGKNEVTTEVEVM